MYNADQKTRFVSQFSESIAMRNFAMLVFNASEPYEERYGRDVYAMNAEEIRPVIDQIAGMRARSSHKPMYVLREYVKWCRENGIPDVSNAVFEITDAGEEKLRRRTVRNPRHLQTYLDFICEPESENTFDNTIRAYFWLAYAGMEKEDILRLRVTDVYLAGMRVVFNGKEYPLHNLAMPSVRNCATLTQFAYKHPNYAKVCVRDRAPGDTLIRGFRSTPSQNYMDVLLSTRSRKARAGGLDMDLNYYSVWLSGVFYRMYEEEQGGLPVDFTSIVREKRGGVPYNLSSTRNTQEAKIADVARAYRADYDRWKQTLL